jgi:hypothetical protein
MTAGAALAEPVADASREAFATDGATGPLNRNDVPAAVLAPDWMPPETRWPELNELRATHVRLRQSASEASRAVYALERRFEEEDESKAGALKAGFAAGTEPDLPEITSDAERERLLKDARAVSRAATGASFDHIEKVMNTFGNRSAEFASDLDADDHALAEELRSMEAKLAALRAQIGGNERTRSWMKRVKDVVEGIPASAWLMRWADVPVARVMSPAEHQAFIESATTQAYADRMSNTVAVLNPLRDGDSQPDTIRVPANSPLAAQAPADDDGEEVELADLAHEDIVDWLLGTGMFDGEPKPTVADVIEVVEGDNPDLARRVLKADAEAYGGEPRKGVETALSKIINKEGSNA